MVLVETERLFIRQWVPDDWIRFRPLGTDPRVLEHLATELQDAFAGCKPASSFISSSGSTGLTM